MSSILVNREGAGVDSGLVRREDSELLQSVEACYQGWFGVGWGGGEQAPSRQSVAVTPRPSVIVKIRSTPGRRTLSLAPDGQ